MAGHVRLKNEFMEDESTVISWHGLLGCFNNKFLIKEVDVTFSGLEIDIFHLAYSTHQVWENWSTGTQECVHTPMYSKLYSLISFMKVTIMGHIMRKPVYAICEQQRCRSACASRQSDQHLCCSLPRWYNISIFYIRNFKSLPSFCAVQPVWVYPCRKPEDRFSRNEAQIMYYSNWLCNKLIATFVFWHFFYIE